MACPSSEFLACRVSSQDYSPHGHRDEPERRPGVPLALAAAPNWPVNGHRVRLAAPLGLAAIPEDLDQRAESRVAEVLREADRRGSCRRAAGRRGDGTEAAAAPHCGFPRRSCRPRPYPSPSPAASGSNRALQAFARQTVPRSAVEDSLAGAIHTRLAGQVCRPPTTVSTSVYRAASPNCSRLPQYPERGQKKQGEPGPCRAQTRREAGSLVEEGL
jgi:hypothetical protein